MTDNLKVLTRTYTLVIVGILKEHVINTHMHHTLISFSTIDIVKFVKKIRMHTCLSIVICIGSGL